MDAQPLRKLLVKSTIETHIENISEFLYEEGPHTSQEVAAHFGLSVSWSNDILSMMRKEGSVEIFRRHPHVYWVLTNP